MPIARTFQTARNSLQATRINATAQLRGIAGGMGLQGNGEGNNNTPPVEGGMAGPFGMWNFPILSKLKEGGIGGGAAPGGTVGLGIASNAAHVTAEAGTEVRQRQGGIHVY
jgi:hypothetical protein